MANSRQGYLKDRLQQTQDFNEIIKNRSFGQGETEEVEQVNEIDKVVKDVKEYVNKVLGVRILNEEKNKNFQLELFNLIQEVLVKKKVYETDIPLRQTLAQRIMDEILGYGPIQTLLEDESITEIMVSRYDKIYIERGGRLVLVPEIQFTSDAHLKDVIDKIVMPIGRKIDESTPLVDARLPDGSRVNATIPPISPKGGTLTIRKFSKYKLTPQDYLARGSASEKMLTFLELAVAARLNIIVSGGTGSGKTTLLNMLSNYVPSWESIITVEDSCELQLYQDNVRTLESKPPNAEGQGEVPIRELVKNTLRMRPDRIIVGEIRDGSVVDMFTAMSTGHDGSLTTIHANSPKNLVEMRIPILFGMSDMKFSEVSQKQQIVSSVDLIVQISRMRDGSRKITNITHIVGLGKTGADKLNVKKENIDESKIYLKDIFRFRETGVDDNGKITGVYEATGYVPKSLISKIQLAGMNISEELFTIK